MRVVRACPVVIYEVSCNFWDCFQPWQLAPNASEAMVGAKYASDRYDDQPRRAVTFEET